MSGHKHAGVVWGLTQKGSGPQRNEYSHGTIHAAILMDIRDELQALNRVMQCANVQIGFRALARLAQQNEVTFKRRVAEATRKRVKRTHLAARKEG